MNLKSTKASAEPTTAPTTAPTVEAAPPDTVTGPQHLLDFGKLWVAVRRKRRLWVTVALLGMIGGGMVALLMPPAPTAVTRILVVHEQDGPSDGGSLIRTDVALMDTTKIAAAALKRLKSTERPEDFLKDFDVVGLTNNVLEVSVKAPTSAEAARRAKALADAFIADHVGRIQAGAAAEAKAITDQRTKVQSELNDVNVQISGAEAAAQAAAQNNGSGNGTGGTGGTGGTQGAPVQPNAATLDTLYARRAELTDQISQLTQRAEEAGLGAPRVTAGTQIVDAPRPVKASLKVTGATNAGIGLVLGLVVGMALAAVTGVVKDKPLLRKDIAAHLGASVIAQLPARRRGLARFLPQRKVVAERKRVAATLVRLTRDGSGPVSVLELGAPKVAATLATDVAVELAADRSVAIVADPANRITAAPTGTAHPVRVLGADDTSPAVPGETRIGLGSVAPGTAWTDLTHLGGETLLVVRAGHANTAWLHTVARQLADVAIPIVGVVLIDPDPRDRTDGTLWDGLHTALRGRTKHTPVNGTNGSNGSNGNGKHANGNTAELPTRRIAPVTPAPVRTQSVHELPTKRFAPVRPAENDELTQHWTQG
jgi:capsular polysaccharide biosynthesis protein